MSGVVKDSEAKGTSAASEASMPSLVGVDVFRSRVCFLDSTTSRGRSGSYAIAPYLVGGGRRERSWTERFERLGERR